MNTPADVIDRLNQLERSNRFLWRMIGGLALGFAIAVSAGAALYSEDSLMLRDRDGKARFVTGIHPQDVRNIYLSMTDDTNREFLRMGNDPANGSYFFLDDRSGRTRIKFGVDRNDNPYMFFYDDHGKIVRRIP